jgi:hypothetical protein
MLMKYLPQLRGITCYPDGARGGQPLTPVRYSTAIKHLGVEMSEVFWSRLTSATSPRAEAAVPSP